MRILDSHRPVYRRLSLGAGVLLLGVAAVTLSHVQAQDDGPPRPAQQGPVGGKDAAAAKEADGWGPERDGLRTRLVPDQKEYVVGQPAKFHLEMKNFGQHKRMFDSQGVNVNGSIRISDPDGKPVPYVGGGFQTAGGARPIAPGETVVLFKGLDLTNQYLFVKPGSYTLQYCEKWASSIPPSNKNRVKMRPGTLPMSMQVPARLIEILPEGWSMSLNMRVAEVDHDGKITPSGWESGAGTYLSLDTNPASGLKCDVLRVRVWVAEHWLARKGTLGGTGNESKPGRSRGLLRERG